MKSTNLIIDISKLFLEQLLGLCDIGHQGIAEGLPEVLEGVHGSGIMVDCYCFCLLLLHMLHMLLQALTCEKWAAAD